MEDPDLTQDGFLGGRVRLMQPVHGYRAGIDAVILAAAVRATPGQSVLELGCGAGAAILCLGWRVPGLALSALELQGDYAELARRNAAANSIALDVHRGDLARMPPSLLQRRFDHVIANPPYFVTPTRTPSQDAGRETAHAARVPMVAWIDAACRRLLPGGVLTMIQRADRLPDILRGIDNRLGRIIVQPLQPREGRAAHLVLVCAEKGSRTPFYLRPAISLHSGDRHEGDAESYTESIRDVLRDGLPLI